ncbi:MAG: MlaD family protein [Thermodesulfobacteriota bacterium]
MKSKTYFKVGIFVILGALLIVIAIVLFGAGKFFREKIIIETYFDQSVQGLDIGAPLKVQGVQVGNVSEIAFVFNDYDTDLHYVLVRAEAFPDKIGRLRNDVDLDDEEAAKSLLKDDIAKGMRIELSSQGVTGVAFLNIVFVDPDQYQPLLIDWTPDDLYIPSKPGTITLITKAVEDISKALSEINFKELGKNLNKLVTNLSEVNFAEMNDKLQEVLNEMDQTVETLNQSTQDIRRFGLAQQGDIQSIIKDIKVISDDIRQILNTGKQDPAWLIFGDPPPRTNPGEKVK